MCCLSLCNGLEQVTRSRMRVTRGTAVGFAELAEDPGGQTVVATDVGKN